MNTDSSKTYVKHSAQNESELFQYFKTSDNIRLVQELINSIPHLCILLNKDLQVILSNKQQPDLSSADIPDNLAVQYPGKIINCIHAAHDKPCNTFENCRFCGLLKTIRQSIALNKKITNECRITSRKKGVLFFHDFEVTCAPVHISGECFTLLSLVDIGHVKRNEMLENVFFHDILNRLGSLTGLIQVINNENLQQPVAEYIQLLHSIGEMIIEDIHSQRSLKSAENENLLLNIQKCSASDILQDVSKQIRFHPVVKNTRLTFKTDCEDFTFQTDAALLKRILINMIKNAAEASSPDMPILISCTRNNGSILFNVHNHGNIPRNIQMQIFQRSFSTKGQGRGLGTYSMKLLGENYLKGKVYFKSDEKNGTIFTIDLPDKYLSDG